MNNIAMLERIGIRHALLSAILFIPFLVATLQFWGPWFEQQYGAQALDLALGLDATQVHDYLTRYGESGRQMYLWFFLFDFFLPLFGAIMVGTWWLVLLKWIFPAEPKYWFLAAIIAAVPMLADWCENLGFLMQLIYFPEQSALLGASTLIATKIKLFTLTLAQGGFFAVLTIFYCLRLSRKSRDD